MGKYYVSILILLGIEPNKIKCYPSPTLEDGRIPHREVKINIITDEIELKKSGMLDGVTCFYTITNSVEVDAAKVIRNYRDKNKVEESFHKSKAILEYAQFSQQNKNPQT